MNSVFILGGGVAGLTAAHELSERGFNVTIFEQYPICGGKARSMAFAGSGTGGRADLPAEHGFRFFPGFYWHTSDTMKRIWVNQPANTRVIDNFVPGEKIGIAQIGKPLCRLEANPPGNLLEWIQAFQQIFENPSLGVPVAEARIFVRKLLCFLGSGPTRRVQAYEGKSWWDFTEATGKSDAYKNILVRGLSRSLVAMKPDTASTLTVATMLVQILVNIVDPPGPASSADRVLNAPTNDAWITPWITQLQANNVTIRNNHRAKALAFDATKKRITSVTVTSGGVDQAFGDEFDYYVAAVPVEIVQTDNVLFPPALKAAARLTWTNPAGVVMGVDNLKTDWMSGVLFYLNREASALKGHIIHCTSPWALTSITQAQFWAGYPWATKGNGQVRDILSSIISDWDAAAPGLSKTAKQCTKAEIFAETWDQLKKHLANEGAPGAIADADRVTEFLDPAIAFGGSGIVIGNSEPLLVNVVNSRQHRPAAKTQLTNFFLAADYVKTNTDLACMEAANEAARQAVNALLAASGSSQPFCVITPLKEPAVFKPFQDGDEQDYLLNPSREPFLCRHFDQLLAGPEALGQALMQEAAAAPGTVPWWVWALVAVGLINLALLLILLGIVGS